MQLAVSRGGSRTAATSKMERFVIIINGLQPLTIIIKRSILNVAAALDQPLVSISTNVFLVKTEQIIILMIKDEEYLARHF